MRVPRGDGLLPDRFVEIDLDWFRPNDPDSVEEFIARVVPLWEGHRQHRGVIINTGFLVDVVTEFSGDIRTRLPLRSARYTKWREQTYDDLRRLAVALRLAAAQRGMPDVRVGILLAGVGRVVTGSDLYDLASDWCDRHPELYPFDLSPLPGPDLDPRVALRADHHRYASRPDGIEAGTTFADFLADQWAAVSAACELDAIHLRDGFWGPMLYTRRGPYGVTASDDPAQNESWTTAVRDLFAAVKRAAPDALVMAYTSGIGATAEWRSGCVDTEAVLRGGGVDVLIDQTWGGAWQDWWDDWWKGWTNQHTNLLSHGVAVRQAGHGTRHYKLIETWDGWEPFDTVHVVPGKLRWAMWAWSHAAIVTPDGLEVPDGSYISWMNDRHLQLLDTAAVAFVADELGAAEAAAARMTRVGGPILVFDREAVAGVHATTPRANAGEHVEDAVALAMKWGLPVLGATSAAWLDVVAAPEGAIHQLGATSPGPSDPEPTIIVGRADVVSPQRLSSAGCSSRDQHRRSGYHREHIADDQHARPEWVHLAGDTLVDVDDRAQVLVEADGNPTMVASDRTAWWQPPELSDPSNPLLPRSQYGSVASASAIARWYASCSPGIAVHPVAAHQPVTVQWWYVADDCFVLAGNLEAGWVGDARTARTVTLDVGREHDNATTVTIDVPPEACVIIQLGAAARQEHT